MPNLPETGPGPEGEALTRLEEILERTVDLPMLAEFEYALSQSTLPSPINFDREFVALAIDSSALLRINRGKFASDTVDYLASRHPVRTILPGQTVQEFWNSQVSAVQTHAQRVTKAFAAMSDAVNATDATFAAALSEVRQRVDEFQNDYKEVYDETTIQDLLGLIEVFRKNGEMRFVPRSRFARWAAHRHATKTPPGFKDVGDGDYFVWLDILFALSLLQNKESLEGVVIVTQDVKPDWQRNGIAHPVLAAELRGVVDVPLEFWTVEQLHRYVQRQLAA